MSSFLTRCARLLKPLLLAFMVMFAQQAAQLHALAHAEESLRQPHKGKAADHPIEQCIAFHAIGSALTAAAGLQDCTAAPIQRFAWSQREARISAVYRLPARAPPQLV
jgi:hypothetical protein